MLFGDASGGPWASNALLRFIGCGLAQVGTRTAGHFELHSSLAWHFASHELQYVDAGELDALVPALAVSRGHLVYCPDDDKVSIAV